MSLGFTVDALVGRARGGGALRMGLSRVAAADWLQPDFDRAARADAFDRHPDSVIVLPEAKAAAREVAALIGVAGGLEQAARACWEDLCLVLPDPADGAPRLVGGAVAFPTDWRLADKVGRSIASVHAPIHGYAEQLSAGVDHFLTQLAPGPIFGRASWFVMADPAWRYLPEDDPATRFAHVTAANVGDALFVRCERQTLRRLPDSGAVLFTIGVHVAPLDQLRDDTVSRIAGAVTTIGDGEHNRRAAPFYADLLGGYARQRRHRQQERAA